LFSRHPDTGAAIEGEVLPYWDTVCDTVLRATEALPFIRYSGWDIVVDDSGTPVIIEANNNTGVDLFQVHSGVLRDARVRRFYEACKVR
jgi:D-alanine-D-alanine ligase-like ATP-grasp enzyme